MFHACPVEFSLNEAEIQWIQGFWEMTEVWIGVNLKILSDTCVLLVLWYHSGLLHKGSQVQIILLNSVKTFKENAIDSLFNSVNRLFLADKFYVLIDWKREVFFLHHKGKYCRIRVGTVRVYKLSRVKVPNRSETEQNCTTTRWVHLHLASRTLRRRSSVRVLRHAHFGCLTSQLNLTT